MGRLMSAGLRALGWFLHRKLGPKFNTWAPLLGGVVVVAAGLMMLLGQNGYVPGLLEAAQSLGIEIQADPAVAAAILGLAWGILLRLVVNPFRRAMGWKPLQKPRIPEKHLEWRELVTMIDAEIAAGTPFQEARERAHTDAARFGKLWRHAMNNYGVTPTAAAEWARGRLRDEKRERRQHA